MRYVYFFLAILALNACVEPTASADDASYYDFQSYFQQEISRLKADSAKVMTKNVTLNKITEQKQFTSIDWSDELALFKKIAIKPINWQNGYTLDSMTHVDETLSALYYSAKDPKLDIKQIIITDTMQWKDELIHYPALSSPYQLLFNMESRNAITHTAKKLVYKPAEGFLISGFQKTKWLDKTEYTIRAWWVN